MYLTYCKFSVNNALRFVITFTYNILYQSLSIQNSEYTLYKVLKFTFTLHVLLQACMLPLEVNT